MHTVKCLYVPRSAAASWDTLALMRRLDNQRHAARRGMWAMIDRLVTALADDRGATEPVLEIRDRELIELYRAARREREQHLPVSGARDAWHGDNAAGQTPSGAR